MACINPADLRPGLWLSGEVAQPVDDWSFVNDHGEIFVEVVGILRPAPLDHGRVGIAAPSE